MYCHPYQPWHLMLFKRYPTSIICLTSIKKNVWADLRDFTPLVSFLYVNFKTMISINCSLCWTKMDWCCSQNLAFEKSWIWASVSVIQSMIDYRDYPHWLIKYEILETYIHSYISIQNNGLIIVIESCIQSATDGWRRKSPTMTHALLIWIKRGSQLPREVTTGTPVAPLPATLIKLFRPLRAWL